MRRIRAPQVPETSPDFSVRQLQEELAELRAGTATDKHGDIMGQEATQTRMKEIEEGLANLTAPRAIAREGSAVLMAP